MRSQLFQRSLLLALGLFALAMPAAWAQTCPNPIDDNTFFVKQQYQDFLGRQPTANELSSALSQINACFGFAPCVHAQRIFVSRSFWNHSEFRSQSMTFGLSSFGAPHLYDNWDFVALSYYVYLRRAPNDPPDNDFSGHAFWLNDLNTCTGPEDNGNRDTNGCYNHIIEAFLVSTEYRARFGC